MPGQTPIKIVKSAVLVYFSQPSVMLKIWTEEFLSTILRLDPKFIALHCQEVGGKNYEKSMRHVEDFVRLLMSSEELRLFDKIRVYLDEDYSSAEHFTALGNFYFVHESLKDVLLWDFQECTFVPVSGKEVHSGNIEAVTTKEKAKFPQEFFPECKWSRKGFLRTRWSISGTIFDLINIHLFHDASNFIAMETFPSVYSKTRRRALEHTLDRFHNDKYSNVPYFLFGDFNFRTDTAGVIKKLTEDTQERRMSNKGNISKLQFHNKDDDLVLTLGKKEFSYCEHQNVFMENSGQWLREYDRELEDFDGRLFEFPIKFVPSYPFEEDINEGSNYMKTRVPAWCDRVLLSATAKMLIQDVSSSDSVEYGIIGPTTCMGDHKPVYLRANLALDEGMINCCCLPRAPEFCFRVPDNYVELLSMLPDYHSYASERISYTDRSTNLLHAAPIKHDPYTPDSMDSPSPNAMIIASVEATDVNVDDNVNGTNTVVTLHPAHAASNLSRRVDRAVSPALLKSKLELIVRSKKQETFEGDQDTTDIKRSPSDCCLRTWPNHEDRQWTARTNRCNSDVSWQRSHLLTQAWIQGKGQQGYHSFGDFVNRSSRNSTPPEGLEALPSDLIIPRISIINASNFESNESSVYFHDDKYSNYSDNKLSTYSDRPTKSLSGEAISSEKSDELCEKLDESNRLNLKRTGSKEDLFLQNIGELITSRGTAATIVNTNLFRTASKMDEVVDKIENDRYALSEDRDRRESSIRCTTHVLGGSSKLRQVLQGIKNRETEAPIERNTIDDESCGIKTEALERTRAKCNEIDVCNDTEISRYESKHEIVASKVTTRSNSVQSQDTGVTTGNVKLKLKACQVTERYKHNIVGKKSRCKKCCCIVS
ncbi:Type I inositol 1,4,5-trisphosphate 5-phosphatase [Dufourea novaeangliae]|uniref:inositol-polyphosphate 5-phosphatase n=1 Tax=Dufourea novaeangliae TaxID=178035 RepID=A0A154PU94_DUFNO|nr:Type I inositol 1,4,5-trisphosphate 5-phosphatase [Dufourea novaeangliae]